MQEKQQGRQSEQKEVNKLAWYLGGTGVLFFLLFCGICIVDKMTMREDKDPEFHEKRERIRKKWSPKITFFENLAGWIFALLFIYYIALR